MLGHSLGLEFEDIAEQHSEKDALRYSPQEAFTYQQLNARANQIARHLISKGVGLQDVVGLTNLKTLNTFASILACLKIGAIYTILDRASPMERLRKILGNCQPRIMLVDPKFGGRLAQVELDGRRVVITDDSLDSALEKQPPGNLPETRNIPSDSPAYIMYTSGSTGTPKGAVMTHDNVLNFISWTVEEFRFQPTDVLTNLNPLFFDNSVFDFYSALFSGACLVPFDVDHLKNPEAVVERIDECGCTTWFSVPSLLIYYETLKSFCGDNMKSLKRIIFGGEGYPKSKLKRLFDIYGDRVEFINVYGPTECTCMCSAYRIRPEDLQDLNGLSPLGKIIDQFGYLILDEEDRQVPQGEVGELCLLGPHVGRGYYSDDERTQQSFVANPFKPEHKEIMYRTGDLVRISAEDGKLYFVSRKDYQIKHMGYRIELGEIEHALNTIDYILEAAALYGEVRGFGQIVAVVKVKDDVSESAIKTDLKRVIPDYMIPQRINVTTDEIAKNPNGKIDRRKLAESYLV